MKHLRLFESFKEEDIDSICDKYCISEYTINEDGSINVDENVDLSNAGLTKLPLKFRNAGGEFYCHYNYLTSLEGCPETVGGNFECESNRLTSLEGCSKSIGGSFYCHGNQLTSLENGPKSVSDGFICSYNYLTSLKGCPKTVGGIFDCSHNKIATFEHLPLLIGDVFNCTGNPIWEIWKLFKDYSKIEFLNDCDAIREPDAGSKESIIILDRLNFFLEEIGKPTVTEVKGYKCI